MWAWFANEVGLNSSEELSGRKRKSLAFSLLFFLFSLEKVRETRSRKFLFTIFVILEIVFYFFWKSLWWLWKILACSEELVTRFIWGLPKFSLLTSSMYLCLMLKPWSQWRRDWKLELPLGPIPLICCIFVFVCKLVVRKITTCYCLLMKDTAIRISNYGIQYSPIDL